MAVPEIAILSLSYRLSVAIYPFYKSFSVNSGILRAGITSEEG